jgi:hypothetical protein
MLKMSQRIRSTLLIPIIAAHDGFRFLRQMACSQPALAAENLFLRKQLAFYQEHKIRPRRLSAARFFLLLSRLFDRQAALAIVKPDAFLRWQREAYKRFWQWKSRAGVAARRTCPSSGLLGFPTVEISQGRPVW